MHRLFIDLEEILYAVRIKVLHNALTEFSITLTVLSPDAVSTDGVRIGNWIYLTLKLIT